MMKQDPFHIRMLVIDDEEAIREGVATFFGDSGCVVLQASNGAIGIDMFRRQRPDIVLVDLRMPEVDGIEVLKTISRESPKTPVIVISGTGMLTDAIDVLRLGAWDYILKPLYDMEILKHSIEKALERSRLIRENEEYRENLEDEIQEQNRALKHLNAKLKKELAERTRTEARLRESERQFRDLIENTFVGISIIRNESVVFMNPEQKKICGKDEASFSLEACNVHPEDHSLFMNYFQSIMQTGVSAPGFEMRIIPADQTSGKNTVKWVHCRVNQIQYQGETAALITMVDTTRAKELEQLVQIKEKMAALGHVAAGIAHEIRNPLSGINILLGSIKENFMDPDNAEDIMRLIDDAQKASDKISAVIKRVLDFSRPGKPNFVRSDINDPISEAVELGRTTLRKSGITISVELSSRLPRLYVDHQMIEQVILNLINNAAAAMKTTTQKDICIQSWHLDAHIFISVLDTGVGIPDHLKEKVFDPFFTTRSDGSGIGLSICQRIVADHGGTIRSQSPERGGTEFIIKIPIEKRNLER